MDVFPRAGLSLPEPRFLAAFRDGPPCVVENLRQSDIGDEGDVGREKPHDRAGHRVANGAGSLTGGGRQGEIVLVEGKPLDELPAGLRLKTGQVVRDEHAVGLPITGGHGIEKLLREGEKFGGGL